MEIKKEEFEKSFRVMKSYQLFVKEMKEFEELLEKTGFVKRNEAEKLADAETIVEEDEDTEEEGGKE